MFNTTVAWITLRATLSRRRALLFALPALILILLTVALRASRAPMRPWPSHVLGTFGFSVLIPLTALPSRGFSRVPTGTVCSIICQPVSFNSSAVRSSVWFGPVYEGSINSLGRRASLKWLTEEPGF